MNGNEFWMTYYRFFLVLKELWDSLRKLNKKRISLPVIWTSPLKMCSSEYLAFTTQKALRPEIIFWNDCIYICIKKLPFKNGIRNLDTFLYYFDLCHLAELSEKKFLSKIVDHHSI